MYYFFFVEWHFKLYETGLDSRVCFGTGLEFPDIKFGKKITYLYTTSFILLFKKNIIVFQRLENL